VLIHELIADVHTVAVRVGYCVLGDPDRVVTRLEPRVDSGCADVLAYKNLLGIAWGVGRCRLRCRDLRKADQRQGNTEHTQYETAVPRTRRTPSRPRSGIHGYSFRRVRVSSAAGWPRRGLGHDRLHG